MRGLVAIRRILGDAIGHFNDDDGWAMASHLALSALLALFPFLIFAASLASFVGARAFADTAVHLIFDTWPAEIAAPIAKEVMNVLTVERRGLLTVGILVMIFFASNGVEALRVSLNRAYRVREKRSFVVLRAQSIAFVIIGTMGFIIVSTLLLLAPLAAKFAREAVPWVESRSSAIDFWRILLAWLVIVLALGAVHLWLPAGYRRIRDILPGMLLTLTLWLVSSYLFTFYLSRFSTYASTYAGLASIMVALVFLYMISVIFIMGGELNAAVKRYRETASRRHPPPTSS